MKGKQVEYYKKFRLFPIFFILFPTDIPVVILTGLNELGLKRKVLEMGADNNGIISLWNASAEGMFGYTKDTHIEHTISRKNYGTRQVP